MEFGIFFFSSSSADSSPDEEYRFLLEVAKTADALGYRSLWTPERHFHEFGGIFANPAITSAAIATVTSRIQLRAGSLVSPLHDTVRLTEDWSMVDNISKGRVAISFGSGWNVNDFVFAPARYETRRTFMFEQIETFKQLWRGETVCRQNGAGKDVDVKIFPRPFNPDIPLWVTSSGNAETFQDAGRMGLNILTHMIGQDFDQLKEKIVIYREARTQAGLDAEQGTVALMLHTFVNESQNVAKETARNPLRDYLRSALQLETASSKGGGYISGGHRSTSEVDPELKEELLDIAVDRYLESYSLIGDVNDVGEAAKRFAAIGIDEFACLVDFGLQHKETLSSVKLLGSFLPRFKI